MGCDAYMDEKIIGILLAVLLAVFLVISATFYSSAGITTQKFLNADEFQLIKSILTIDFLGFILSIAVSVGIILAIGKKYLFKKALTLIYAGSLLGVIISAALYPIVIQFAPVIIFMAIGVPFGISYLNEREKEVKYLNHFRSGISGAGRIFLAALIGLLICLLLNGIQQQSDLEKNFVPQLLNSTVGSSISIGDQISNQLASQMAQQQQNTIDQIITTARQSNNPTLDPLIAQLEAKKTELGSQQSINNIIAQLKAQKIDLGAEIIRQFPLIKTMSAYAWLILSITGFIIMLLISNILAKNLAGLFCATILLIIPQNDTKEEKK
jgi:hypothetical protein